MSTPRVIIESRRTAAAAAQADALVTAGMHPVVCTGPTTDGGACPLLVDEPCPVLEEADAIVYDLDLERDDDRAVLRALVTQRDALPVITERTRDEARRFAEDLTHCSVVLPFSADHTAEAVVEALVADGGWPGD